ncbi:MAG: ABC transporter permease [Clostridia bacterium]|nr:ABC transporter permease [Clostridia bacterium]
MTEQKKIREPLFRLVKRTNQSAWLPWVVRIVTVLSSFVLIGILTWIAYGVNPLNVYGYMLTGAFGTKFKIMRLLRDLAILLLFALAVTPAFKMKFWNIGAEGQVLMGAFCCMVCIFYLGGKIPNGLLLLVSLIAALLGGAIWAVIPALFKAKWNTNETLFTLMMNYVAIQIILYAIKIWAPSGTGILTPSDFGHLPKIGGDNFWFSIIVALVMTALMFTYLRYTKHGYEITVVGESENTARYIGINVKKVIIRTLIVSGIICGITGFLLVAGINHTVSSTTAGGRGFTAILVSWLAKFNPIGMIFTSLLVVFLSKGMDEVMTMNGVTNSFFSQVVTGVAFLMIIGCEFFINYKIIFRSRSEKSAVAPVQEAGAAEGSDETPALADTTPPEEAPQTPAEDVAASDDAAKEE